MRTYMHFDKERRAFEDFEVPEALYAEWNKRAERATYWFLGAFFTGVLIFSQIIDDRHFTRWFGYSLGRLVRDALPIIGLAVPFLVFWFAFDRLRTMAFDSAARRDIAIFKATKKWRVQ